MKPVLITSSILIVLIAVLRPLLRGRIDPRAQYALWLIAVLRLLVPVEWATSAYSAMALLERAGEPRQIVQSIAQTTVPVPGMSYEDAYDQALQEYHQSKPIQTDFDDLAEVEHRARELQAKEATLAELAAKYAGPVWLGGAALVAAWFLLVNLRLRRKLRTALPVEADCSLPVRVTPDLPSPCLCGAFRPAIYVTPDAMADPDRLRHVLAHELTHYRHRDHWWALVRCLCLCAYWFNPLVWWAGAMSRQDCELACDAGAIRRLGEEERLAYGRTLVAMIASGRNSLLQTATTMTGGKRRVRERVTLIARKPKTVIAAALALALVLGGAVGCTFTGAPEEPAGLSAAGEPSQDPIPLSSDALNTATLPARLLDLPEELRDHVEAGSVNDTLAVYYFKKPGEELNQDQYLLIVSQRSEEDLQRLYDESPYPAGGSRWFAKGDDRYYVFQWNTSIEYDWEDEEQFNAASRAVREFAEKTVLETEGVEPFQLEEPPAPAIKAITNQLLAAPVVELELSLDSISYPVCSIDPSTGSGPYFLNNLAASFQWEEFDWGTTEDPQFPLPDPSSALSLHTPYGSEVVYIRVYQDSDLVAVHDTVTGTNWYHATAPGGLTPFRYLRNLYDEEELMGLRVTSVPDRGQSHQEVVKEWIEGYEGALTKCAPGSQFACTYVQGTDVESDWPDWLDDEQLEEFAQSHGLEASEFTKTWFGFRYSLLFLPADEYARNYMMVGNTHEYDGAGQDAPEGTMVYTRQAIMRLVDGKWTCGQTGTSL